MWSFLLHKSRESSLEARPQCNRPPYDHFAYAEDEGSSSDRGDVILNIP